MAVTRRTPVQISARAEKQTGTKDVITSLFSQQRPVEYLCTSCAQPHLFVALLDGWRVWMSAHVRNGDALTGGRVRWINFPLIKRLKCRFCVSCNDRGGHIQLYTLKSQDDTIVRLHSMAIPHTELSLSFSTLEKLRAREIVQRATVIWVWVWRGLYLFSRLLLSAGLTPLPKVWASFITTTDIFSLLKWGRVKVLMVKVHNPITSSRDTAQILLWYKWKSNFYLYQSTGVLWKYFSIQKFMFIQMSTHFCIVATEHLQNRMTPTTYWMLIVAVE